jgi:methylenetetrahydrofolate reductase (NADPH)
MRAEGKPLYADITWGAGGTTSEATLDIALTMHQMGVVTNMHLTCTNIEAEKVDEALEKAKAGGIRNICALRGDAPEGSDGKWVASEGGFACGEDLVGHIRKRFGDYFCLSVAGYPEGHPEKIKAVAGGVASLSPSELKRYSVQASEDGKTETVSVCSDADWAVELQYLKAKVDAGADFILTQMFFDCDTYKVRASPRWGGGGRLFLFVCV